MYYDKANMESSMIPNILNQLDSKMDLFKQYETTSERYNDW